MTTVILGLGTALPPHSISQEATASMATALCCTDPRQAVQLQTIYGHAGVRSRASVLLSEDYGTGPMGPQTFYRPRTGEGAQGHK